MRKGLIKSVITMLATVIVGTSLTGCGGDKPTEVSSGKETTITYSIWDKNQEPGMKAMISEFEKQNPTIKVALEVTPWDQYWTKLEAAANGGVLPDVFWMHAKEFSRYSSGEMLLDLTDMIGKSGNIKMDKFPNGLVELYKNNNKNYAIPKDFDTVGLWYNKKLFDEAGVEYPKSDWTWDDFLGAAKKLTNSEKGVYGYAAHPTDHEGYYNFIYQNDGQVIKEENGVKKSGFDMPETIEAIKWYVDLIAKEKVSPTSQQLVDTPPVAMFQSGKVAMVTLGSWMVSELKGSEYVVENCDVAVLPKNKKNASVYNGLGYSVASKTKNKEAALKFVEFLGGKEANKIQADNGTAISAYEGTQESWVKFSEEFNLKAYPEMIEYGEILPFSKNRSKWEKIQNDVLAKVFNQSITVEEGCKEIAEKMNEILAQE